MPDDTIPAGGRDLTSLRSAQEGVRYFLAFAVGQRQLKLSPGTITAATAALRLDPGNCSSEQESGLWAVLDDLSCAAAPATLESIRTLDELTSDLKRRPATVRAWWSDSAPRKVVGWARLWNLAALIGLLVFQIYTLIGTALLKETGRLNIEFTEFKIDKREMDATHQNDAAVAGREAEYINRIDAGYRMLAEWNRPWQRILSTLHLASANEAPVPETLSPKQAIETEQRARSALEALGVYLLPLFYGLLGASTFILRQLREAIDNATFTLTSVFRYRLRLALGAVLGTTVGLFFTSDDAALRTTSLSLVALAFLAGYGVEAVFALFDYAITRIRDLFRVGLSQEATPPPQTAEPATDRGGSSAASPPSGPPSPPQPLNELG